MSFRVAWTDHDGSDTVPLWEISRYRDLAAAKRHCRDAYRKAFDGRYDHKPFGICILDDLGAKIWELRPDADYLGIEEITYT